MVRGTDSVGRVFLDVVYPVRPGNRNEELRYSLRSLDNLYHRRVYLLGSPPAWTKLTYRKAFQQGSNPHTNTTKAMRLACEMEEVTDPFIWMNDDYFILKPFREIPNMNRGHIDNVITNMSRKKENYTQGMVQTKNKLVSMGYAPDTIMSYELHMPLVVHKGAMLEALAIAERPSVRPLHKRTLYGNLCNLGGESRPDNKYTANDTRFDRDSDFISTSDVSFERYPIGKWLREKFPNKGIYEI
jgi:hypothetical protein